MEPIKRGSSIFRVKSIKIETLSEDEKKASGYSYRVTYDEDPMSFTRCDVVEEFPEKNKGEILTQSISTFDKKGDGLDIVRIWRNV